MARAASASLLLLAVLLGTARAEAPAPLETTGSSRVLRRLDTRLRQLFFGKALAAEARRFVGVPYRWGGKDAAHGFDCSGFTQAVYAALGVSIPAGAQAQWQAGAGIDRLDLMPGDLVFFSGEGSPFHVGIYAGNGSFLHAPGAGKRVQETRLQGRWTGPRWLGARRWPAPQPETPSAPASETVTPRSKEHP